VPGQAQISKRMKRFIVTWEYQNISGFETWEAKGNELIGKAYRIKNETDTILIENMRLVQEGKKLILYAQVINQNEGKEIKFTESDQKKYKFVNNTHDFPKSIYYQFKFFQRKKVTVLFNHPHKQTHSKSIKMVRK
jgi:hypothetical protein